MRHGTPSGYVHYKCRCVECTEANRLRHEKMRRRRCAQPVPEDIHGKRSTYTNWGCRCQACSKAHADYHRPRKP